MAHSESLPYCIYTHTLKTSSDQITPVSLVSGYVSVFGPQRGVTEGWLGEVIHFFLELVHRSQCGWECQNANLLGLPQGHTSK